MSVHDVAAYVLQRQGPMTAMKLQKLVFYSQAWSLVWDEAPLFDDRIEAWANGPVAPELYRAYRGSFLIGDAVAGDPGHLNATQRESIDAVLGHYGDKTAHYLSELTHREAPWLHARAGMTAGERGDAEISHAAMAEYYGSL